MKDRVVNLVILDRTGHTNQTRMLSTLTKVELMAPGQTVLVNGAACKDWDEVLDNCKKAPAEEPLEVASVHQIVGG